MKVWLARSTSGTAHTRADCSHRGESMSEHDAEPEPMIGGGDWVRLVASESGTWMGVRVRMHRRAARLLKLCLFCQRRGQNEDS